MYLKNNKIKKEIKGKYSVSYVSKYGNVVDTTYHQTARSLGNDVAWLISNGYEIKKIKKVK